MPTCSSGLRVRSSTRDLGHAEWLALLLDHEATYRNDRRLDIRIRHAKMRQRAVPEDINYRAPRGLDRRLFDMLVKGDWIAAHENLAIIGPTGIGKSWLACALGHKACRDNRSVLYTRLPRLIDELALTRGDGRLASRMKSLARVDLLILDDWGLEPLDGNARHHLLELLEERYANRSTLVTSQLPIAKWHELIGDPTYADAILDRLVHNAHRIELNGESMCRKTTAATT
jgi:DNA replication protein DnaC